MTNLKMAAAAIAVCAWTMSTVSDAAEVRLKPYVLAEEAPCTPETYDAKIIAVREALRGAGFEVAGETNPYDGAHIFVITNAALKKHAAASPSGGFGAAQRVAVTRVGDQAQVSWTNPVWMANAYRMGADLSDVAASLRNAIGGKAEFGSREGMTAKQLRDYHYMVFMPHFTDQVVLAEYASHAQALATVEAGLASAKSVKRVARVDVPGTEQTLFSVAILAGDGADTKVMQTTDSGVIKHTAHLSYELLVSGKRALMLHGKFRIAQSFPDLSMRTFMKISGAPSGIEDALRAAVK
jgi:hypothetical protein